jgi:hypothetical protein
MLRLVLSKLSQKCDFESFSLAFTTKTSVIPSPLRERVRVRVKPIVLQQAFETPWFFEAEACVS